MKFPLEDELDGRFEELAKALGYDDLATADEDDRLTRDKPYARDRDEEFVTE
jgi:hypothetical protein